MGCTGDGNVSADGSRPLRLRRAGALRCRVRDDASGLDVVEIREVALEIAVAERLDHSLVWRFAVAAVERVDDVHPLDDLSEWREAHAVEPRVVDEVEEGLM